MVIFPMRAGSAYEAHAHRDHQLAWASSGILSVETDRSCWVLPSTRALWIPAGVVHETRASSNATMRSVYAVPSRCPKSWNEPMPLAASALLGELIGHLERAEPDPQRRARSEAFFFDLLEPLASATIEVRLPRDHRAARVAQALQADPGDRRDLAEWGREVGGSARTLARGFAQSGTSFQQWRTLNRLRAALPALAAGEPVSRVAEVVGYETTSSFVAAFRRQTGLTPRSYFKTHQARLTRS
ncbi:MAG: AraC family transcriptional regulator [Candidatus Dormibacteria bacterium]